MATAHEHIDAEGSVDWLKVCPYALDWATDADRLHRVTHRPTGDAVDLEPWVVVTKGHMFLDPWSDMGAKFVRGASKVHVAEHFAQGMGPAKRVVDAKGVALKNIADEVDEEITEEAKAKELGKVEDVNEL